MIEHVFKEILPILLKSSPILASALGSPISGLVLDLLSSCFNVSSSSPEDLVNEIKNNIPSASDKLQLLEKEYSDHIKSLLNIKLPKSLELSAKIIWDYS